MKFDKFDKVIVEIYLQDILNTPVTERLKEFFAHGKTSLYQHCLNVAYMSYSIAKKHKIDVNLSDLLTGAFLHDFYFYDWHEGRFNGNIFKMHGFTHPTIALNNADAAFLLDDKVKNIIVSHMWPVTLFDLPASKEAWIVTLADKICAFEESFEK